MNDKFYSLKKEKQDRMINGAMQVFAKKGYALASTDEMVRVSNVSKGLWFHYFESKQGLYDFVASYSLKYAMLELMIKPTKPSADYLELRYEIEERKIRMVEKYPYLPLFLYSIVREDDPDVEETLRVPRQRYAEQIAAFTMSADMSALKAHEDYLLILDMLEYTMDALLVDGYRAPVFSGERYLSEVRRHIDALRALL